MPQILHILSLFWLLLQRQYQIHCVAEEENKVGLAQGLEVVQFNYR